MTVVDDTERAKRDEHQVRVLLEIRQERDRQDAKFGTDYRHTPAEWLAILAEEFGEVAADVVGVTWEGFEDTDHLREELVQVAAVAVKWIEAIDAEATDGA